MESLQQKSKLKLSSLPPHQKMPPKYEHSLGYETTNYYGKFIPNLSTIVHPLNQLLQKDKEFQWTAACDQAF